MEDPGVRSSMDELFYNEVFCALIVPLVLIRTHDTILWDLASFSTCKFTLFAYMKPANILHHSCLFTKQRSRPRAQVCLYKAYRHNIVCIPRASGGQRDVKRMDEEPSLVFNWRAFI